MPNSEQNEERANDSRCRRHRLPSAEERTTDSRFFLHRLSSGVHKLSMMYSQNLRVEADGLPYNELNVLRAVILEPIFYVLMGTNMLLAYSTNSKSGSDCGKMLAFLFAHWLGFLFNILRLAVSVIILAIEITTWPVRVLLGMFLAPLGLLISSGHIYALACSVIHAVSLGAGPTTIRRFNLRKVTYRQLKKVNAGGLGEVYWYKAHTITEAAALGASFKLRQRCGVGPECVWIRGHSVFVSHWSAITINLFLPRGDTISWSLLDLSTFEWRTTVIECPEGTQESSHDSWASGLCSCIARGWRTLLCRSPRNQERRDMETGSQDRRDMETGSQERRDMETGSQERRDMETGSQERRDREIGKWATTSTDRHLGEVSSAADLEALYNSPLGWNKYHRMSAEKNQVKVERYDRRAVSHFIAGVSSMCFYLQFRDASNGWLGLSIELYGLIIANYALVTAYAAELLIGKVRDVVDAKSDRYGVIVTRAIDRGYVRGFHVPKGRWLGYGNGEDDLPWHVVEGTEVNLTCSSYVFESEQGTKINVLPYNTKDRYGHEENWVEVRGVSITHGGTMASQQGDDDAR